MCYPDSSSYLSASESRCVDLNDDGSVNEDADATCTQGEVYCYDGEFDGDGYGCNQGGDEDNGYGDEAGPCC